MRGVTLQELIRRLRVQIGHSTTVQHGAATEEQLKERLRFSQEWLWENYDWEHLDVERDIQLQDGLRYYDVPSDITAERIHKISFKYSNDWITLDYGIEPEHYSVYDSDADERSWPVCRWNFAEDDVDDTDPMARIEVWPIPSQNGDAATKQGYLRVGGIRNLGVFTDNNHKCTLDANLIVLQAAVPIIARQSQKDAERVAAELEKLRMRLQGNGSKGRFSFTEGEQRKASDVRFEFVRK